MRRGFTLFEMIVTVGIVAVAAALVIPMSPDDSQFKLRAASSLIISDIELTQTMTMAHPGNPVFVQFDVANEQYYLAHSDAPGTPLIRDDTGEPYLVKMGTGRAAVTDGVTLKVTDMAADVLLFNAQGGVFDITSEPSVILECGEESVTLHIATTTGTVTEE